MDALLTVLGIFGLIPIACMTFFYGVIPVILVGLQILGAVEGLRSASQTRSANPPQPKALDRAA